MNKYLKIIGPGLLVAATGVGAGDLATSALAGSHIGLTAISAIVIGGVIKYFLNEGIARWQFHTSTTLLDGALSSFGKAITWMFLIYLIIWSYTVGVALISASGASFYAILPIFENPRAGKIIYGIVLSLLGYGLVKIGGFRVFEHVMSGAVVLMVMAVFYSVFQLDFRPSTAYSIVPSSEDITWYLAVLGGVGGTVTVLCYGYWVKESQRDLSKMTQTRIDLGISYFITVLLGVSMVLIGTKIQVSGGGSGLLINLSDQLDQEAGVVTGWVFRIGAFAAIFSSLLGVWQSVPYLFIDVMKPIRKNLNEPLYYQCYLLAIAVIPLTGLYFGFTSMQKAYALSGALFTPMLALVLLILGITSKLFKNSWLSIVLLVMILFFFVGLLVMVS